MQIKTVCQASEEKFDTQVNNLIAAGWKPDLSTYRTAAWGFASSGNVGGDLFKTHEGCYNSIIMTKE